MTISPQAAQFQPQQQLQAVPPEMDPAFSDAPLQFPPNFAENMPLELQQKIVQHLLNTYVFPYICERQPYEKLWDKLATMYRVRHKISEMQLTDDNKPLIERMIEIASTAGMPGMSNVSDTLIFDAVDRLKNLGHFISWKDGTPVQFAFNKNYNTNHESPYYRPISDKIKAANALLDWNNTKFNVYHRDLVARWHHYLYGISFVNSEFKLKRNEQTKAIESFGTTFEPISIRNLWIDYRVNSWNFEYQPCPFYFEIMPRFAATSNPYDAQQNPFGYANLPFLLSEQPQWLFSGDQATNSLKEAFTTRLTDSGYASPSMVNLVDPAKGQEAMWTLYPMLQYNPQTGVIDPNVPPARYIVNIFSASILSGQCVLLRLQPNFYPKGQLPIYASAQMPDLDSGAYGLSIGEVLQAHYDQLCTVINQFIDNKNRVNAPPSWHIIGSPSFNMDVNRPNAKISVQSSNDMGWLNVVDASASCVNMLEYLKEAAKTTSKATDAILGQAMGSRTSATEAGNVFQTAMSGVTVDVNIYGDQILGGYAQRCYDYAKTWGDPDILSKITGQLFCKFSEEDLFFMVELRTDTGSRFIESITKQQNLRYAIEAGVNSPVLNQAKLWRALGTEMRMPELLDAVDDGEFDFQVGLATEQAIKTYMGLPVAIDPNQNHEIAIRNKTQFLQDTDSIWNKEYAANPYLNTGMTTVQALVQQIQIHQQFLQMQQIQQQAAQTAQMEQAAAMQSASKAKPGQ